MMMRNIIFVHDGLREEIKREYVGKDRGDKFKTWYEHTSREFIALIKNREGYAGSFEHDSLLKVKKGKGK